MHAAMLLLLIAGSLAAHADTSVQALIDAAVAEGRAQVTLPGGELRLDDGLLVDEAQDLVIDGAGSTLVFTRLRPAGIELRRCSRVTLRNLIIDYDPLPFTQGTIVTISEDRATWEFEVHEGYPDLTETYLARQTYVYDPATHHLRRDVADFYPRTVEGLSPRRGRITVNPTTPCLDRVQVGDFVVLNVRSSSCLKMNFCRDITLEDITVRSCPGIAFIVRYAWGENVFRRLTVEPGPPPAGANQPRLMSSSADAFNYAYAARGPLLERCRFRAMGDDSVNLHGPVFAVCAVGEGELVLGRPYGGEPFEQMAGPGEVIRGLRAGSFAPVGAAALRSLERERAIADEWRAQVQSLWPRYEVRSGSFFRARPVEPLGIGVGDWVEIPATAARGFIIRDCEFRDHRARGMRIQSSHGVIEGNVIQRIQGAGITIGPEFGFWRESGWVEGVIVRDNIIEDVGRGCSIYGPSSYTLGAISVFARVEDGLTAPPANREIAIEGNTIDGCPVAGVHVTCARHVRVTDNRIAHTNYAVALDAGSRRGLSVSLPIEVRASADVAVEGNEVSAVGVRP